jgi:hypothetical protein
LAENAAKKIVHDLEQDYLLADKVASNKLQLIHLIGHSRGAAVNAEVSRLLDQDGYNNIIQFTSLDGFSTDWPNGAGTLGDVPITSAVANAPGGRKVNYRVQDGLGELFFTTPRAFDAIWQYVTGNSMAEMPTFVSNEIGAVLREMRAPDRQSAGFKDIGLVSPGSLMYTNHLNITGRYLASDSYPGGLNSLPSYRFIYDNFLVWNRFAGLPPAQNVAEQRGQFYSQDAPPSNLGSFQLTPGTGFAGGSFESLGLLFSNILAGHLQNIGDAFFDAWIAFLNDSTRILELQWQTVGSVQLIPNNSSVQLTQTSVAASIGQVVTLPATPGPVTFTLTVIQAGPGDKVQLLQDGQVVGEVVPTDAGASGAHSFSLSAAGGQSVNLTFRVAGPATDPAIIKLDNLAIGGQTNWAPVAFDAEYGTNYGQALSAPTADLLASAYDVDDDPLTVSLATGPAHGQLNFDPLGAGRFVYTPNAGFSGPDQFTYTVSDGRGGTTTATVHITVGAALPPVVAGVQVNNGAAQHSMVNSLTVTFSEPVTFVTTPGAAFAVTRGDGMLVGFTATVSTFDGTTVVTLSNFTGSATEFGSLADGRYTLTALASQITVGGQALDGNGDGTGGDDYKFGGAQGLFRFYGDVNGDGVVNGLDFGAFRSAFGTAAGDPAYLSFLDFNGDGAVNGLDFGQFRSSFGTALP